jgi:SAM-dependent methyltransferase
MVPRTEPRDTPRRPPAEKWQGADCGARYVRRRWGSQRRAARDPRIVAELLERHGVRGGPVLDAACGTGRLREALSGDGRTWVGLDASAAMLGEARRAGARTFVRGDVGDLPFADGAFAAAVANRLLHHFADGGTIAAVLRELVRVSAGPIVVSYWNAASLPAWRRRLGLGRDEGPSGRVAHPTELLRRAAREAGAELVEVRHAIPVLSQQSFAVLRSARP